MKNIIILLFVLSIIGCNNKKKSSNIDEVISFMIDKKSLPLPPPPTTDTTTVISKKMIDSLLKVKLKVGLYPKTDIFSENELKKIPKKHLNEFKINDDSQKELKLNGITTKKGHKVALADTIELKKSKDFKILIYSLGFQIFIFLKIIKKSFLVLESVEVV